MSYTPSLAAGRAYAGGDSYAVMVLAPLTSMAEYMRRFSLLISWALTFSYLPLRVPGMWGYWWSSTGDCRQWGDQRQACGSAGMWVGGDVDSMKQLK